MLRISFNLLLFACLYDAEFPGPCYQILDFQAAAIGKVSSFSARTLVRMLYWGPLSEAYAN